MNDPSIVPTRYWHSLPDSGRVQCDVCPRHCQLSEGQKGLCFVRACQDNQVVLTSYGRSSGYCIDPIEKKPLYHFLPGTPVLSFGTAGCNLTCAFCQNWEISKSREIDTLSDEAPPERIARAAAALDCRSVAFTYNDPVIFLEYAVDVARACRDTGVKTVAVTAGYICDEPRREFFSQLDAVNIDLKAFSDEFYRKTCGGELEPVLDTLRYLRHETDIWLEVTTLLIPGMNDSDEELDAASRFMSEELGPDVPWHFSAFHPDHKLRDRPQTSGEILTRACEIARNRGMRYVYTGNVHDESGGSTYCAQCGEQVIGRDWYVLTKWNLAAGHCGSCGAACPGVFEDTPGSWGARRQPVRLSDFV
ncbi:MAG: AmmeMemoRadiSam system radical SAM enzyme [Deltaproteobacteria bacterium]|nr:AmmeMemoRadiSam system radical SAM enzyme [Deltaproteobacteria bacterium]